MFDVVVVVVVDDAEDTNSDDDDLPLLLPMLPPLVLELMPVPLRPSKFMELFVDVPAPDKLSKLLAKEAVESFRMLLSPLLLLLVACGSSVPKPPPRLLANCSLPNGPPGKELVVAADLLRF